MPHFHQSHPKEPLDQRQRMLETPIDRLILSLAVPTIISMLITSIYNMADTFFVSHIVDGSDQHTDNGGYCQPGNQTADRSVDH